MSVVEGSDRARGFGDQRAVYEGIDCALRQERLVFQSLAAIVGCEVTNRRKAERDEE